MGWLPQLHTVSVGLQGVKWPEEQRHLSAAAAAAAAAAAVGVVSMRCRLGCKGCSDQRSTFTDLQRRLWQQQQQQRNLDFAGVNVNANSGLVIMRRLLACRG
jgi:hypothetical protein